MACKLASTEILFCGNYAYKNVFADLSLFRLYLEYGYGFAREKLVIGHVSQWKQRHKGQP